LAQELPRAALSLEVLFINFGDDRFAVPPNSMGSLGGLLAAYGEPLPGQIKAYWTDLGLAFFGVAKWVSKPPRTACTHSIISVKEILLWLEQRPQAHLSRKF
jgi:hypothetical protein